MRPMRPRLGAVLIMVTVVAVLAAGFLIGGAQGVAHTAVTLMVGVRAAQWSNER